MPDHEPTPRELFIRYEALYRQMEADRVSNAQQFGALVSKIDGLVATLQSAYVPKGTYDAHREAWLRRLDDVEAEQDRQSGSRRQMISAILVGVLLAVVGIVLSLARAGAGVASP